LGQRFVAVRDQRFVAVQDQRFVAAELPRPKRRTTLIGAGRQRSAMSSRDDEELAALLSDLETTLEDLRAELDEERRGSRGDSGSDSDGESRRRSRPRRRDRDRPRQPFNPPSVGDILRFTEEYTIPTVITTLEATIEALELFRRLLGVATPGESSSGRVSDRRRDKSALDGAVTAVGNRASDQLANRLSDLRTALEEADLPENEESRTILEDARELTDEIEARIRDSRDTVNEARRKSREGSGADSGRGRDGRGSTADGSDGPVTIEVGDASENTDGSEDGSETGSESSEDDAEIENEPQVDVEAELQTIKRELGEDVDDDGGADDAGADETEADDVGADEGNSDGDDANGSGDDTADGNGSS
jgi:hypothetical protein